MTPIFDRNVFDPAVFECGSGTVSTVNRHWPLPEIKPVQLDDTDAEWLLLLPEVFE